MFKFLKNKLKKAVSVFSKKAEKEAAEEEVVEEKEIQLDEKAIKEEEKKLEEEKKKKEKELKKLEEKRKRGEEQKKKEEEQRKREEGKREKEEAELKRLEEERKKKEEEERKKKEAELKRLEEEKKKKEAEIKKAKEEEKKKKEEELRELEEERKKKEAEENKRIKEERRKQAELRKQKEKEEEEKRKREEVERIKREEERRKEEEREKKEEEERKEKEEELKQIEQQEKEVKEKKGFFSKLKERFKKKKELKKVEVKAEEGEELVKEKPEVIKEEEKEIIIEEIRETEKKGFFAKVKEKVTTKKITGKQFDELFWELELALLENNVAVEVIEKIKEDLKNELVDVPIRKSQIETKILESLKKSIESLFQQRPIDLVEQVKSNEKPYIIIFVGVNGSGKTTTIAKIAKMMLNNGLKPIIAASDTFRAAAIHQLEEHGKKLGVKVVKHDYGADPSAVAFDAIKAAKAHNMDVVLIDTAGRMHSNINLVAEMEKIVRVTKPHMKIFVAEAIAGNDVIEQSKVFNEAIDIDGIILAKADIDEKGGAAVSVSYVTGKPILYLGTGQLYSDIELFDKEKIIQNLGL